MRKASAAIALAATALAGAAIARAQMPPNIVVPPGAPPSANVYGINPHFAFGRNVLPQVGGFNNSLLSGFSALLGECSKGPLLDIKDALSEIKYNPDDEDEDEDEPCGAMPKENLHFFSDVPSGTGAEACKEISIDQLAKELAANKRAWKQQQCKLGKLAAIEAKLSCFKQQATELARQLGEQRHSFQSMFDMNTQGIQQFDAMDADAENQLKQVNEAHQGLMEAEKVTREMLAAMPTEVQGWKQQREMTKEMDRQFNQALPVVIAGRAKQCFQKVDSPNWRCFDINGKEKVPETLSEYVACKYAAAAHKQANGQTARTQRAREAAFDKAKDFRADFEDILLDIPSMTDLPDMPLDQSKGAEYASQLKMLGSQAGGTLTLSEFRKQLNSRLKGQSQAVNQYLNDRMTACFAKAKNSVEREKREGGNLYNFRKNIEQREQAEKVMATQFFDKYEGLYLKNMEMLEKLNPQDPNFIKQTQDQPFQQSVDKCRDPKASFNYKQFCMDDFVSTIRKQLNGGVKQKVQLGMVKGMQPRVIECQGITGCIQVLDRKRRDVEQMQQGLKTERGKFITQANSKVDQVRNQVASVFSLQTKQAKLALEALEKELQGLGLEAFSSADLGLDSLDGENLTPGENGLYGPPENMLEYLSGAMEPKMFDTERSGLFKNGMGAMSDARAEINAKAKEIRDVTDKMENLIKSCPKREANDALAKLDDRLGEVLECMEYNRYCKGQDEPALNSLLSTIAEMTDLEAEGISLADYSNVTELSNGVPANKCARAAVGESFDEEKHLANCSTITTRAKSEARTARRKVGSAADAQSAEP